ncbi:MAG: 3-dehydroquinate synthase II [Armatimonadetes bacterium]|nr:3-dehydroquinate synthase II [Armatimonadota bacterium]
MKTVWVSVVPWDKDLVTAALEAGADGVYVEPGRTPEVKALGLITAIAPDGDIVLGRDVHEVTITGKADEQRVVELSRTAPVIVTTTDWTIIPLENLIAAGARIVARVQSAEEALTAAQTLERGVEGVLLETADRGQVRRTVAALKEHGEQIPLQTAEIIAVQPLGMGDRVCIDTCTNMRPGQGMLVGNSSAALFLVHAETQDNPYVDPRPFRVNAGAVHAYVRVPGGRTRYLADLRAGDQALIVDSAGATELAHIGRVKVERRPLALVTARVGDREVTTILQNAETIRLVTPAGAPLSVVDLRPGSEVLIHLEAAGRHFGMKVEETIVER